MGISNSESSSPLHWRYALALEEDLLVLSRYIEFDESNFGVFSTELASLLLSAGSEVDVAAKQLCRKINPKSKAENIGHYAQSISAALPTLPRYELVVPRFGLALNPWFNWRGKSRKKPVWWGAYNNVKHQRHTHYKDASLGNVLNAVGGLLIMVLYLYRDLAEQGRLSPNPMLFRPEAKWQEGTTCWDTEFLINYSFDE